MAEILGVGLTHYPPLAGVDENMANILRWTLEDPDIPDSAKDPGAWPEQMRREYGEDGGTRAAATHRAALTKHFRELRTAIDEFSPDVMIIWGDDQYENFHEDVIPPYSVLAYDDFVEQPFLTTDENFPNVWGEPKDRQLRVRGHQKAAKYLAGSLLEQGIDTAYAYRPLHAKGWGHAFTNTLLYLDYDRRGLDVPAIACHINCYGRKVIAHKGSFSRVADSRPLDELDPPSPSPSRCMDVGRATAMAMRDSPWRTVLVASSSWSHAFLTDKTNRLYPDMDADRQLFEALRVGDYSSWQSVSLDQVEASGQQEMLNWFCLVGAMQELGRAPTTCELVETYIFNSNKVFASFLP